MIEQLISHLLLAKAHPWVVAWALTSAGLYLYAGVLLTSVGFGRRTGPQRL